MIDELQTRETQDLTLTERNGKPLSELFTTNCELSEETPRKSFREYITDQLKAWAKIKLVLEVANASDDELQLIEENIGIMLRTSVKLPLVCNAEALKKSLLEVELHDKEGNLSTMRWQALPDENSQTWTLAEILS